jgi:hypothetical protein
MNEIVYLPNKKETAIAFVKRVVAEQPNRELLRIVVQLVEIALGELAGRPCNVSVTASKQQFTLTLRHEGKPIDNRMICLMDDHIDRAKYNPDGDSWVLTLRRDIPSFYISPEDD